jgi:hypothetical protein
MPGIFMSTYQQRENQTMKTILFAAALCVATPAFAKTTYCLPEGPPPRHYGDPDQIVVCRNDKNSIVVTCTYHYYGAQSAIGSECTDGQE